MTDSHRLSQLSHRRIVVSPSEQQLYHLERPAGPLLLDSDFSQEFRRSRSSCFRRYPHRLQEQRLREVHRSIRPIRTAVHVLTIHSRRKPLVGRQDD